MKILVLAEINNGELAEDQTSKTVSAASTLGKVDVLCASSQCSDASTNITKMENVENVLVLEDVLFAQSLAESYSETLIDTISSYSHVFAPSSSFGKNVLPRIGGMIDVMVISDVSKVISEDTFLRPIYAGNAFATVKSNDKIKCVTIRPTSFDPSPTSGGSAEIENCEAGETSEISKFIKKEEIKSDRPELGTARVVVSGGRGMQSGENFKLITAVADKLNAAIGASRAAVDAGYITNDHQVGQTGKVVVPDLYIAVGISGAIQHLAGMKESKVIVAINKDGEAPIFSVADYGLEADLFDALPKFLEELNKLNTIQK